MNLSFAEPRLLLWLLILPVLALLRLGAGWRARRAVAQLTAPRLRAALLVGVSPWRAGLIFTLQLLALACFLLALAGPRWGEDRQTQVESGRNVILAIDTSRSMLADDLTPNRLTRAKLAAQDLMGALKTDRVGLIAFAGNAYLQAPLTTDHEAILEALDSLDFTSVPRGGSEIGRALRLAIETFEKNPARNHGLILFSDGGEPDAEVRGLAEQAAKKNILVLTVGVGTESGALIPDPDPERAGEYVRDAEGNVVRTRLEESVLVEIARLTRGRHLRLGSQPLAAGVVRDLLTALQAQANEARQIVKPIERYQWPLSMGVLLLMIAWFLRPSPSPRPARGLPAAAAAVFLFAAPPAEAAPFWASWFSRGSDSAERAREAFAKGDPKQAADLLDRSLREGLPDRLRPGFAQALGYSAFKARDFDRAVAGFSQALQEEDPALRERAHQGLAHSLYDQGDQALAKQPKFTVRAWRDSVRHFDAALEHNPQDTALRENREFVQKRLEELQEQINQQEQKQKQKGDKQKGEKGEKGEEGEEGEEGEAGDKDGQGKDRSRKESLGKKEEGEGKEEELPEGQIQAANQGEEGKEGEEQAESGDEGQNEATGFSRNEARAFLRTYADDQKKAQLVRPRDPAVNGKDW
jgi:Ca-activated chloride channel family protein